MTPMLTIIGRYCKETRNLATIKSKCCEYFTT